MKRNRTLPLQLFRRLPGVALLAVVLTVSLPAGIGGCDDDLGPVAEVKYEQMVRDLAESVGEHEVEIKKFEDEIEENKDRLRTMKGQLGGYDVRIEQQGAKAAAVKRQVELHEARLAKGTTMLRDYVEATTRSTTRPAGDETDPPTLHYEGGVEKLRLDLEKEKRRYELALRKLKQVERQATGYRNRAAALEEMIPNAELAIMQAEADYDTFKDEVRYLREMQAAESSADSYAGEAGRDSFDDLVKKAADRLAGIEEDLGTATARVDDAEKTLRGGEGGLDFDDGDIENQQLLDELEELGIG